MIIYFVFETRLRGFFGLRVAQKLVLEDQFPDQVDRFPGEKSILMKYGDLGSISRSLYFSDGRLNQDVAEIFDPFIICGNQSRFTVVLFWLC